MNSNGIKYTVKPVVCDYGVCMRNSKGEEVIEIICNSQSNAKLIAAIMEKDDKCNSNEDYVFSLEDAERILGRDKDAE